MRTEKTQQQEISQSVPADTEERLGTVEGKIRVVVKAMGEELEPDINENLRINTPAFGEVHYTFNDWSRANIDLDRIPTPCIVFLQPASGTLLLKNGQVRDIPEAAIAFLDRATLDENAVFDDTIIERMKRLALAFIGAFNDSGLFEPIEGELKYRVPIDILDSIVSGIIIQPRIKEVRGIRLCDINIKR